jgi:hypothetical protein
MPRVYGHDEIVTAIDKALIDIIKKVLDEMLQDENLRGDIIFLSKIEQLKDLLVGNKYELIRRINRPPAGGVRERPDIELFGGYIVIEVKTSDNELKGGEEQLKNYISKYYRDVAKLGIVTTGLKWVIYNWSGSNLKYAGTYEGDENEYNAGSIYGSIIKSNVHKILHNLIKNALIQSDAYRLVPKPDNIFKAFYPIIAYVNELAEFITKEKITEKALYQSYKEIILRIYSGIKDDELIRLFTTHTLLQMIVNIVLTGAFGRLEKAVAEPLKACSGELLDIDISVPHLMWWREASDNIRSIMREACEDAFGRALLFNWESPIVEDVFSHLYEDFIDRDLRYKIGEYYTPWWLIEFMIHHLKTRFNTDFKNKIVLDPACGSGRFLVRTFYEKVNKDGEDPENAYYNIIGLDILPLAVAIARAELMIAYYRVTGKNPPGAPLVFWGDFLSNMIGLEIELILELKHIIDVLSSIIWSISELNNLDKHELVMFLTKLENRLADIFRKISRNRAYIKEIKNEIYSIKPIEDPTIKVVRIVIMRMLENSNLVDEILRFIQRYGNEIWAIPIVSYIFIKFLGKIKPEIVLTNPPWLKLSELPDSKWGDHVSSYVKENIVNPFKDEIKGIGKAGYGGDLSLVFLDAILSILEPKGFVGIVLPAEQSYSPNPHGVGKLLTYAILKKYNCEGDAIFIRGDPFKHGGITSVLILRRG